ncbi:perforin-1-like [Melanotaenia boesemani]|uniref:perforin-1-like n=1 Tax=Melanotaenia boesemani TaxID=1250792 RepID=UPI001C05C4F6|nr:perforin-1-like [Melanotaenia boesemani]
MASRLPLLLLLLSIVGSSWSQLRVYNLQASDLPSDLFGTTDGYVKVFSGSLSLGKTSVRNNNPNPWWEEEFSHFKAKQGDTLKLEVHDKDILFDDLIGVCSRQIKEGTHSHDCYLKKGGTLHYSYTLSGSN